MAKKEVVYVKGLSEALKKAKVPLSPAVKANGFIYVSGQPPFDPKTGGLIGGDIKRQTKAVMNNVKLVLRAAGASMDDIIKVNVYTVNAAHFADVNEVYKTYFKKDPPARTFAVVGSWPMNFDIEIECIAVDPKA